MPLSPEFYAEKAAEYGGDVKTMAEAFAAAIRRGDRGSARQYLERMDTQSWKALDAAKSALEWS